MLTTTTTDNQFSKGCLLLLLTAIVRYKRKEMILWETSWICVQSKSKSSGEDISSERENSQKFVKSGERKRRSRLLSLDGDYGKSSRRRIYSRWINTSRICPKWLSTLCILNKVITLCYWDNFRKIGGRLSKVTLQLFMSYNRMEHGSSHTLETRLSRIMIMILQMGARRSLPLRSWWLWMRMGKIWRNL